MPDDGSSEESTAAGELSHDDLMRPIQTLHPRKALTFPPTARVAEVIAKMIEHQESCVLIVEENDVAGIFTERDVLLRLHSADSSGLEQREIRDVMTPDPEILLSTDDLSYALNRMAIGGYRHIPILHPIEPGSRDSGGKQPAFEPAVLSVRYLISYLADFFPDIVYNIPPQPSRKGTERFGA